MFSSFAWFFKLYTNLDTKATFVGSQIAGIVGQSVVRRPLRAAFLFSLRVYKAQVINQYFLHPSKGRELSACSQDDDFQFL